MFNLDTILVNDQIRDAFIYFITYSFIGWVLERTFFRTGGFLKGPFRPIYGFGALLIIIFLNQFFNDIPLLFVMSLVIMTLWEYFASVLLELIFRVRWWNYSDQPFNIKGRICLFFSLCWGLLGIIFIRFVHPFIDKAIAYLPSDVWNTIIYLFILYLIIDVSLSTIKALQLKKVIIEKGQDIIDYFNKNIL